LPPSSRYFKKNELLGRTGCNILAEGRSGLGCNPREPTEEKMLHYPEDKVSQILRNVINNYVTGMNQLKIVINKLPINANPALYPRSV
jgi:hypothetical protein